MKLKNNSTTDRLKIGYNYILILVLHFQICNLFTNTYIH